MKPETKKLLIITYYWPPAGGPGVQRWLKFVKYLPDFDVQPVVYVPQNPVYPMLDDDLLKDVSDKAIVLKQKIVEPYTIASFFSKNKVKKISSGIIPNTKKQSVVEQFLLWIRGNIFIPDARCLWVNPSVKFLEKYIAENNITNIVTSGPPHSLHLIGLKLKNKLNIKWFADFRDPWTTIGYHKSLKLSSYATKKHKKLEKQVLNSSDCIIVTSQTTKTEFEKITNQPVCVITNGYDIENVASQNLDTKFSLAHIGSLLSNRNPLILWQCLSELVTEIQDFKTHLEIKFVGAVSQEVLDTLEQFELTSFLTNLGYVCHNKALVYQKKAQLLLLIEIDSEETKSIIPGKLFEYMVAHRPILAIGPPNSDFSEIIKSTNTGVFFTYNEKIKLKSVILEFYNQFLENNLKVNAVGLQQYSRKNLTKKLVDLIYP